MSSYKAISLGLLHSNEVICHKSELPYYEVKGAVLHKTHYLTLGDYIFTESLHENFSPSWVRSWIKTRGYKFGNINATELEILKDKLHIQITNDSTTLVTLDKPVLLFQYNYDHNFHHFLVSALPRLQLLKKYSINNLSILVRASTPKYQLDFIHQVVSPDKIIYIEENSNYLLKKVFLTDFLMKSNPNEVNNFYSKYFCSPSSSEKTSMRKILLSRSDAVGKRPIINEKEINKLFLDYNFYDLTPSSLSISNRLSLFNQVEHIAGVFSAGFANILLAHNCKSITFIEHPSLSIPREYKIICKLRGIKLFLIRRSLYSKVTSKIKSLWHILSPTVRSNKIPSPNGINNAAWSINSKHVINALRANPFLN